MQITIGIPAYNEAENLQPLLLSLLKQDFDPFILDKIIVISDGSTDATVTLARSISDPRIQVIAGRKRIGQALRQNQLFQLSTTPITVLLNADILPVNHRFIYYLCLPFVNDPQVGLTSAKVVPEPHTPTFINRVLSWHHSWKVSLYEVINNQDNIYLCHGRARGFSQSLSSRLQWPPQGGEDGYSYIFNHHLGLKFCYTPLSQLYCTLPHSLTDHINQSLRFLVSLNHQSKKFPKSQGNWYRIPLIPLMSHLVIGVIKHPINAIAYGCIMTLTLFRLIFQLRNNPSNPLWNPAVSTKKLTPIQS